MMPASSNLTISFITTSFMLGFSRRCASREGLAPSSRWIWCIQMDGSIPFRSTTVHPIASLCFFNTSNRLSSWSFYRFEAMMTGRVSLAPRKACLSLSSRGFNSSFSGDSREGTGGVLDVKGKVPLVVSMDENLHWLLSLANHGPLQHTGQCRNLQTQSELNKLSTDHQPRD
jgi:hypothetical protein